MIGRFSDALANTAYRHGKVWSRQETTGPDRLCIGGGDQPVGLFQVLAQALAEPLFILVVLRQSFSSNREGRYESRLCSRSEVASFVGAFERLFSEDSRANLWVGEADGRGLIVLDEHDLIYAYGPLATFETVLIEQGFVPGSARIPNPHGHHFNHELDPLEEELVKQDWNRVLPLDADDG